MGLPQGNVTYLFTDVAGSSRMWEQAPESMRAALQRHDALLCGLTEEHGGVVVRSRGEGDSFFCVFSNARAAVEAVAAIQLALHREPWPVETPIRVRAALHTGVADQRDGSYYGNVVNRCARIRGVAHPGQTLLSDVTQELVGDPPPGLAFRSLGQHRFRDLQRPEHLYQLEHPELPSEFPPLASLSGFRHNLPVQTTSFVGRERELSEVVRLLAGTRLLTLHGSGGSGKTRLALQAAGELLERYPDGVWFVELDTITHPALVLQVVAQTLGVTEEPSQALAETLSYFLQAKSTLLILDNCEHVVDAAAQMVHRLLRLCPGVTILATSQKSLGIAGETLWDIPTLTVPKLPAYRGGEGLDLERFEAPRLFLERARMVRPDFAPAGKQSEAVVRICERLDGIPLAIELAAPWVRMLSTEQIAERLDDSLRLLTRGARTAPTRHQTLSAAVDWSCGLLTARERALLHRLSVFSGGWTLEAAQEICSGSPDPEAVDLDEFEVMELLLELVDKSLVVVDEDEAGARRYRLLETVRQYGEAYSAGTGERHWLHAKHREYFLRMAEAAEPRLQGVEQANCLRDLDKNHDNLRAAVEGCKNSAELQSTGLRLAYSLWRYWYVRGLFREGLQHFEELLAPAPADAALHLRALSAAGNLARARGLFARAEHMHLSALQLARAAGDRRSESGALNNLALLDRDRGELSEARPKLLEAERCCRELGDQRQLAAVLLNLGCLLMELGELDLASGYLNESLKIRRALGGSGEIAKALHNLVSIALLQKQFDRAAALQPEVISCRREIKDGPGLCRSLELGAEILLSAGDPGTAAMLLGSAAAHRETTDDRRSDRDEAELEGLRQLCEVRLGTDVFLRTWSRGRETSIYAASELLVPAESDKSVSTV